MKRKLAVLLTAATVFSAILPTTCMAAEKKADTIYPCTRMKAAKRKIVGFY